MSSSNPLVAQATRMPGVRCGASAEQHLAETVAGYDDEYVGDAVDRRRQIADDLQLLRERGLRQVAGVAPLAAHALRSCAASRPQSRAACPARANWIASAVPQEPLPRTAMGAAAAGPSTWISVLRQTGRLRGRRSRTVRRSSPAATAAAESRPGSPAARSRRARRGKARSGRCWRWRACCPAHPGSA